jgi:hypothetical protein
MYEVTMFRACCCGVRDKEYMKNFGGVIDWASLERFRNIWESLSTIDQSCRGARAV